MEKEVLSKRYRYWLFPALLLVGISCCWPFMVDIPPRLFYLYYLEILCWAAPHLLFTLLIYTIQRYYHTSSVYSTSNVSTSLLLSALAMLSYYGLSRTYVWLELDVLESIQLSLPARAVVSLLFLSLVTALFWIEQEQVRAQHLRNLAINSEREVLRIELNSLQQQFKPHFLFNSLNSINALTLTNPEEARRMVHLLSEFMRTSVRQNHDVLISFSEEIKHIQLYTEIEKVRFGERLEVEYITTDAANESLIPALILQPLIENAVKYGLYGNTSAITIRVEAERKEQLLIVRVQNPYDAELEPKHIGTGFGLPSVEKKMLILYRQANLVKVTRNAGIFTVTLSIPQA